MFNINLNNNNIKSKITLVLAAITLLFFVVIVVFCYTYFKESRKLILDNYNYYVAELAQRLNKNIITAEHSASDLSVIGNTLYEKRVNENTIKEYLLSNLDHYNESIAAGFWYKPYTIDKQQKFYSINAIRDEQGEIVFDDIFQSEGYNYPEQMWFKQIITQVKPGNVVWTLAHGIKNPNPESQRKYPLLITAGAGIYSNGELVGISTVDWDFDACIDIMDTIKPTPNSFVLFADKQHNYVFFSTDPYMYSKKAVGKKLEDIPWYDYSIQDNIPFTYYKLKYIPFVKTLDNGMMLIVNIPQMEMLGLMYLKVFLLLVIMGLLSGSLISLLYLSLNQDVIKPINKLISIANKISQGNTNTEIKIEKPAEFALLAKTYNKMMESIKQITSEQTKMNYELSIARSIQLSSLPNIFPPFPEHKEFSIYASMDPAKEVGGDFYDFYFKDSDNITFLVADVSGKGIPAALFMMTVKTLINNLSQTIDSPKELAQTINQKLCNSNEQKFFVTLFACIVNIKTGKMTCINCGHNPPLIKRHNGKYEYLNIEPNLALGILEDFDFQIYELNLNAGDAVFLYTDGITEAKDPEDQLYGEKRLEECLNNMGDNMAVDDVIKKVKEDVKKFTKGCIQSDDLTMVSFQLSDTFRIFERPAIKENYHEFINWIHTICKEWNLSEELSNKIDMCGEEIFANICFYAYPNEVGNIKVSLEKNEKELIMMIFEDSGLLYNPLEKPDPDITKPGEERQLGGLGIYMVKQMAKQVEYHRVDNKNILSLKFEI